MKTYYYVFYTLCKFWDAISSPKVWSDFKAGITISAVEALFCFSLLRYYRVFFVKEAYFGEMKMILIFVHLLIFGFNAFVFVYSDRWKKAIAEFDKWPPEKLKENK